MIVEVHYAGVILRIIGGLSFENHAGIIGQT